MAKSKTYIHWVIKILDSDAVDLFAFHFKCIYMYIYPNGVLHATTTLGMIIQLQGVGLSINN